MVNVTF